MTCGSYFVETGERAKKEERQSETTTKRELGEIEPHLVALRFDRRQQAAEENRVTTGLLALLALLGLQTPVGTGAPAPAPGTPPVQCSRGEPAKAGERRKSTFSLLAPNSPAIASSCLREKGMEHGERTAQAKKVNEEGHTRKERAKRS